MARKQNYSTSHRSRRSAATPFGSRTDIGCVRDHNEDSLVVAPPLFVVADGMGGHAAGEVASEIAVHTLIDQAPRHADADALAQAVETANEKILQAAKEGLGREGMGTTCTAAVLENERLVVAHVGDSRAYLLPKQGHIQQLTRDHSLMADMIEAGQITPEEARFHPKRSVITKALGSTAHVSPTLYELNVQTGDRLMLCSDGLSSMIRDEEIEAIMRRVSDPQRCAAQLVNEAITAGGHDNVTVIVVDIKGFAEARRKKANLKAKAWATFIILAFIGVLGGVVWGANTYLNTTAYLINDNGNVAIYRGVPGSLLGLSFSHHEMTSDVSVDELQPGTAARLNNGIQVDSMEAAEKLIEDYKAEAKEKKRQQEEREKELAQAKDEAVETNNNANAFNPSRSGSDVQATTDNTNTSRTEEGGAA